jgi:hypothetical protein
MDPFVGHMNAAAKPGTDFACASARMAQGESHPSSERGWGIANLVTEETYRQRLAICQTRPDRRRARLETSSGSAISGHRMDSAMAGPARRGPAQAVLLAYQQHPHAPRALMVLVGAMQGAGVPSALLAVA